MLFLKNIRIKKYTIAYVLIIFALLNAPLRITDNGMTSLFRIFSVLPAIFILIKYFHKYKKILFIFFLLLIYSTLVSIAFYKNISLDQNVFLFFDFILLILIYYIRLKDKDFNKNFFKFIDSITVITIIAALVQYYVGYTLPYIEVAKGQPIGVYLSNGNELSEALCCVFLLYIYRIIYEKQYKYLIHAFLILFISFINDAKLSIIGAVVGTIIFILYKRHALRKDKIKIKDNSFLVLIIISIIVAVVAIYFVNPVIHTRDYSITVRELIFDSIFAIFSGQKLSGTGSIHDRTTAIIYGFQELKKTFLFGIGAGNSIIMLQKPEYYLMTAKSMHNIMLQFIVEFGFVAIFCYGVLIKKVVFWFSNIKKTNLYLLKGTFLISFIFISSQSSVGILSNYYTIMVLFYVLLLNKNERII